MAITIDVTTDAAYDLDTLKFRLALEGCNWSEEHLPEDWDTPMIRLRHPQHGNTWFRGWETVEQHCDNNWVNTYWPHS